jgi:hypothetical protein
MEANNSQNWGGNQAFTAWPRKLWAHKPARLALHSEAQGVVIPGFPSAAHRMHTGESLAHPVCRARRGGKAPEASPSQATLKLEAPVKGIRISEVLKLKCALQHVHFAVEASGAAAYNGAVTFII